MTSAEPWSEFAHDPRSPAYAALRASDADRDIVLRVLGEAYADGRLDAGEFDDRTSGVQEARTLGELPIFLGDLLPVTAHSESVPLVPARPAAEIEREAVSQWRGARNDALRMWLFVSLICWTIWLVTSGTDSHPWPLYPMAGTAVPLLGTLVTRRDMIASNQRRIVAKHEKAIAKAEKKRAALEKPQGDQPEG